MGIAQELEILNDPSIPKIENEEFMSIVTQDQEGRSQQNFECKFTQKGNLKGPITAVHQGKKYFECKICNVKCDTKQGFNMHMQLFHEKRTGVSIKKFKKWNIENLPLCIPQLDRPSL